MNGLLTSTEWRKVRAYDLPVGLVRVYPDRSCRFFPHWCEQIVAPVDRSLVAKALWTNRAKGTVRRLCVH